MSWGASTRPASVTSFKVPTEPEREHDYLWRVHQHTPSNVRIAVFDRSHYEEVLIVRVHELVPEAIWTRRYDHINAFERHLADEGTTILKFFLYIDRDEQRERFQARVDDATKRWKFQMGDLDERKRWDDYIAAFEDVLERTATDWAPWYLIPANRKWFRNLAVATIVADTLDDLEPAFPQPDDLPANLEID
jgi:PPK2 family polyphosphate:nucleotide phosphotransferase